MRHWGELTSLFKSLRRAQGEDQAKEVVRQIERFLADKNEQARASYEEAGEDLLTLFKLNVPNTLNTSLLSTNAIENVFKNLRRHIGRVCRWRKETKMAGDVPFVVKTRGDFLMRIVCLVA
jgi:transposase-like protein